MRQTNGKKRDATLRNSLSEKLWKITKNNISIKFIQTANWFDRRPRHFQLLALQLPSKNFCWPTRGFASRYLQRVRTESSGLQADSYRAAAPASPQQHDGGLKEKVHGMALRLHRHKQQRPKEAVATQRSRRGQAPLHVATFRAAKHEPVAAARAVDRRRGPPSSASPTWPSPTI